MEFPTKKALREATQKLRALDHPVRIGIMQEISAHPETGINNTQLFIKFRVDQSVMSQQVSILVKAGYLNTRREGKFIYYTLSDEAFFIRDKIDDFISRYSRRTKSIFTKVSP